MSLLNAYRVFLAIGLLITGCNPSKQDPFLLESPKRASEDVQNMAGLTSRGIASSIRLEHLANRLPNAVFRNSIELNESFFIETTGGGLGVLDFDRDGELDIVSAGGGRPDKTMKKLLGYFPTLHRGLGNWQYRDISTSSRIETESIYSTGVSVADFDADGFTDVLMLGYDAMHLYRNQGDGTLELVPPSSCGLSNNLWGTSAAFLDADNDGLIDVYIANYLDWSFENNPICEGKISADSDASIRDYCGPRQFKGLPDVLYRNAGDGTFLDITEVAGIKDQHRGMGVLAADFDGDHDIDLYVANDIDRNLVYQNDGAGTFVDVTSRSGGCCNDIGVPEGSMGVTLGDYNLDGRFDIFVTNFKNEPPALYENVKDINYIYASTKAKIGLARNDFVSWGTAFVDLDLDGDEDLFVVNGHIEKRSFGINYEQHPMLFENDHGKRFFSGLGSGTFLSSKHAARSLAIGDFNRDGRVDFAVGRLNTDLALVQNRSAVKGGYCMIKCVGTLSNRDGIGVTIRLRINSHVWSRQLYGGGSYASSWEPFAHFGISEDVDFNDAELEILWPSGIEQHLHLAGPNETILAIEPHGELLLDQSQ